MDEIPNQNEKGVDQFFTNKDIALKCYNTLTELLNVNEFEVHL
jgi:hypothetical protein